MLTRLPRTDIVGMFREAESLQACLPDSPFSMNWAEPEEATSQGPHDPAFSSPFHVLFHRIRGNGRAPWLRCSQREKHQVFWGDLSSFGRSTDAGPTRRNHVWPLPRSIPCRTGAPTPRPLHASHAVGAFQSDRAIAGSRRRHNTLPTWVHQHSRYSASLSAQEDLGTA